MSQLTPQEWLMLLGFAVGWGTIMANVSNSKTRIEEVRKIVTNGLSTRVYEIDMKLTALKQAHDDRTGCVLKDKQ